MKLFYNMLEHSFLHSAILLFFFLVMILFFNLSFFLILITFMTSPHYKLGVVHVVVQIYCLIKTWLLCTLNIKIFFFFIQNVVDLHYLRLFTYILKQVVNADLIAIFIFSAIFISFILNIINNLLSRFLHNLN